MLYWWYIDEDITWPRRDTKFRFEYWKIFQEYQSKRVKVFETREEKFCISRWPCDVLFIISTPIEINNKPLHFRCERRDLLYNHSNGDQMYIICRPEGPHWEKLGLRSRRYSRPRGQFFPIRTDHDHQITWLFFLYSIASKATLVVEF